MTGAPGGREQAMSQDELSYFERRAQEEIELASRSTDARLVAFHYQLGSLYLDRLFNDASDAREAA